LKELVEIAGIVISIIILWLFSQGYFEQAIKYVTENPLGALFIILGTIILTAIVLSKLQKK